MHLSKMSSDGPSTRQKERKDDDLLSNSLLQELNSLNCKIYSMKEAFERQLNSKVDNLCVLSQKFVMENREGMKAELAQKTKEIQDNLDMDLSLVIKRI